ncbi:MAG: ATP-binding cassette domain-containing protein [Marinifilaceae bacterium]
MIIECEKLGLTFDDNVIFANLSFRIEKGSKVCISGPSGRGKTTLLKMLAGLVVPQSGTVRIKGQDLLPETVYSIRKEISWLPQNVDLPVESGEELARLLNPKFEGIGQTGFYLEKFGLEPTYYRKNFSYVSGGQKQRILLAVCLNLNKPILLLDEPTSALDEDAIDKLIATISSLQDLTVVSVSHNEKWIRSCDKIIQL